MLKVQTYCDHFDTAKFTTCQKEAATAIDTFFESDNQQGVCEGVKKLMHCKEQTNCKETAKGSFYAMASVSTKLSLRFCVRLFFIGVSTKPNFII